MVAEEHEVDLVLERHPAQGSIARPARPGLDAVAGLRPAGDPLGDELDRLAGPRPAPATILAMREPGVAVRAQAVMDVQREDPDAERRGGGQGGMEQRRRIAAAAVGDADPVRAGRGVSAPWCR
jgi:hypothetical protein